MPILTRAVWKSVKEFQEVYDLKKTTAYKLIHMEGFPKKYVSDKTIRVNMAEVDEFMDKMFNQ